MNKLNAVNVKWDVNWTNQHFKTAADVTEGYLQIAILDHNWFEEPVLWNWVELLEWMADNWSYLNNESITDEWFSFFEGKENAKANTIDAWDFLDSHDLSASLAGAIVPSLIVWRDKDQGNVLIRGKHLVLEWKELLLSLETIGNEIVERLNSYELDERSEIVMENWSNRSSE